MRFFISALMKNHFQKILDKEKIKGYIGFDCTAKSLHVGSLLQIVMSQDN